MVEKSARILLVDDEQSIQTLLSYPLRKDGYEVVRAADGREALNRFAEQAFDLVVLDVMLPQLDGLEVCRRLRARSAVPIIMLTAKSEEIDKVLGLELGADDYITKPFSPKELVARIRSVLRRAEGLKQPSEVIRVGDAVELDVLQGLVVAHGPQVPADAPRLDEALALVASLDLAVQLDVKVRGLETGVVEALRRHALIERSFVSPFSRAVSLHSSAR